MNGIWIHEDTPTTQVKSLTEALTILSISKNRPLILAGGTDLLVQVESGRVTPQSVLDIWGISELRGVTVTKDCVVYGALTTHSEMIRNAATPEVLRQACATIGAGQIQNRGTIGGNIANASPAGDTLPVLLALDADVEVASLQGMRKIPFSKMYSGYRKMTLREDEMIARVYVPKLKENERAMFWKVGTRQAQAISKVVFCGKIGLLDGKLKNVRLAVGSVAATTIRLLKTEQLIENQKLTPDLIESARRTARKEIQPLDDIRSTAEYRRWVTGNLVFRFLEEMVHERNNGVSVQTQ